MRQVLSLIVVGAVGVVLGWSVRGFTTAKYYKTTKVMQLVDVQGSVVCELPVETPIIAEVALRKAPDIGWRASVLVGFDSMTDAVNAGIEPAKRVDSIDQLTLFLKMSERQKQE